MMVQLDASNNLTADIARTCLADIRTHLRPTTKVAMYNDKVRVGTIVRLVVMQQLIVVIAHVPSLVLTNMFAGRVLEMHVPSPLTSTYLSKGRTSVNAAQDKTICHIIETHRLPAMYAQQ